MTRPGCGDVDHTEPGYDSGPVDELQRCEYCNQGMCGDIETAAGFSCCSPGCLHELLDIVQKEKEDDFEGRNDWFPPPTSGW